jgi:tRNA-Thr(GGU) m(6)t(6)A37 methyltransferase TsaA
MNIQMTPIGEVHSAVKNPAEMPKSGVAASIEVYPQYAPGLEAIETNSHLQIIGWLSGADRNTLLGGEPKRGTFGLRSPARPNPLGLTPARLLKREDNTLYLENLDFVDGTPILDIKRYSPGWDSIFAARSSRELRYQSEQADSLLLKEMTTEASNFHGETCLGVALGARAVLHAMRTWQIGRKEPSVRVWVGSDGCLADALQAITGATLGNGRLKVPGGRIYRLARGEDAIVYYPLELKRGVSVSELLEVPLEALFTVRRETLLEEKPIAHPLPGTADPESLVDAVRHSLVNGKLPCAVAYQLADQLGVRINEIGHAADAAGLKISYCQLGCFK